MSQVRNNKRNGEIILAFPGMGKTPLSLKHRRYIDLDFGDYRNYKNVSKEKETILIEEFGNIALFLKSQGLWILSNEPKLIGVIPINHVYLPTDLSRSAAKLGVDVETVDTWVQGWKDTAIKHGIPVTFLKVGLDHYLS